MSFEPVEWERLADHEEAPRSTASAVAPMSDERLAELEGIIHFRLKRMPIFVTREGRELVAEVKRQRFEIARANQEIETLGAEVEAEHREAQEAEAEAAQLREQLQSATVLPERWRDLMAERDAARRELAELRELVGNPTYQWASSAPGFFFGPPLLDEAHVRRLVSEINARGGHEVLKRRLVGEWTEVDGG